MTKKQINSPPLPTLTLEQQGKLDTVKSRLHELTSLTSLNLGFGPSGGVVSSRGGMTGNEYDRRWINAIDSLPDARPLLYLAQESRMAIKIVLEQAGFRVDETTDQVTLK